MKSYIEEASQKVYSSVDEGVALSVIFRIVRILTISNFIFDMTKYVC